MVREGDLGQAPLDRREDELARGPAGVAAAERVDVVVGQALHREAIVVPLSRRFYA